MNVVLLGVIAAAMFATLFLVYQTVEAERAQRELARRVGPPARAGGEPGPGVDEHDVGTGVGARRAQCGQQQPGRLGDRDDVDVELVAPGLRGGLRDGAQLPDPGRVDQRVEPVDAVEGRGQRVVVGELDRHGADRDRARLGQLTGQGLQPLLVPAAQDQVVARREQPGGGGAEAAAAAGDQRDLAAEVEKFGSLHATPLARRLRRRSPLI